MERPCTEDKNKKDYCYFYYTTPSTFEETPSTINTKKTPSPSEETPSATKTSPSKTSPSKDNTKSGGEMCCPKRLQANFEKRDTGGPLLWIHPICEETQHFLWNFEYPGQITEICHIRESDFAFVFGLSGRKSIRPLSLGGL